MKRNHYRHCPDDCAAEHQPRERSVNCLTCGRPTIEVGAVCERCIDAGDERAVA